MQNSIERARLRPNRHPEETRSRPPYTAWFWRGNPVCGMGNPITVRLALQVRCRGGASLVLVELEPLFALYLVSGIAI